MARDTKENAGRSSATIATQLTFDWIVNSVLSNEPCSRCGKPIITLQRGDYIVSEYTDGQGRCWDCSRVVKSNKGRVEQSVY